MSQEVLSERYVIGYLAPEPVHRLFAGVTAICQERLGLTPYPGRFGLKTTIKSPCALGFTKRDEIIECIDELVEKKELVAVQALLGSVSRFCEPEDVIHLPVGGVDFLAQTEHILSVLESRGVMRSEYDGVSPHFSFAKNFPAAVGNQMFTLCADACCMRHRPRMARLDRLVLFDREQKRQIGAWTLH